MKLISRNETENFALSLETNNFHITYLRVSKYLLMSLTIRCLFLSLPLCVSRSVFMEINGIGKEENGRIEEENEGGIACRRFCFLWAWFGLPEQLRSGIKLFRFLEMFY